MLDYKSEILHSGVYVLLVPVKCERETEREREREHSPFILRGGRLETSKKQGNHDNQTTNLGNQPGVLTVRARQAAQQGLI